MQQNGLRNMAYLSNKFVPLFDKSFNVVSFSYDNGKICKMAGCDKGIKFSRVTLSGFEEKEIFNLKRRKCSVLSVYIETFRDVFNLCHFQIVPFQIVPFSNCAVFKSFSKLFTYPF